MSSVFQVLVSTRLLRAKRIGAAPGRIAAKALEKHSAHPTKQNPLFWRQHFIAKATPTAK